MGILDFREICSGNAAHKSVKDAPIGNSNLPDDFELFCQEFFTQVKRFRIFRSVSNGPDLGIDLGVEEITESGKVKWLVSCKHYAHSGSYISDDYEKGITERVASWDCEGFIPFYTSIPNSTLSQHILGAEKFVKVERYYKDRIERELLENSNGSLLAARYFPISMQNHFKAFISPLSQFTKRDIEFEGNVAKLQGMQTYLEDPTDLSQPILENLVNDANIFAGFDKHRPYFKRAIEDAVSLYSEMFLIGEKNSDVTKYEPVWDLELTVDLAVKYGLSKAYFICAVWSFWDYRKANILFADFMIAWSRDELRKPEKFDAYRLTIEYADYHTSILKRSLLVPGFLGVKLQDTERDIVARLFAYANPI